MQRHLIKHPVLAALGLIFFVGVAFALVRARAGSTDVQQAKIIRGDLVEAAYAVGTVKAEHTFNLKTGAPSRVLDRRVRIGDAVHAGQPLIRLEGFPEYKAPFDGVITALNYDKGELVFAQTVVLTIVDLNSLYLELSMDERTIGSIRTGQPAQISFEGQRVKTKQGKVRSLYSSDGSFLVMVDADFNGLSLLPSMTADVAVEVGTHRQQLLVPLGAVASAGHVTVSRHPDQDVIIETGASDGKYAVIEKGDLKEGELVRLTVTHSKDHEGP